MSFSKKERTRFFTEMQEASSDFGLKGDKIIHFNKQAVITTLLRDSVRNHGFNVVDLVSRKRYVSGQQLDLAPQTTLVWYPG